MESIRKSNFKIGCFHGKIDPQTHSEARIRNDIYLTGMVEIELSKVKTEQVKIVGYEIPLKNSGNRNECIDLLGYDSEYKPYIFELKKPKSNEKIDKVIAQINNYATFFEKIRDSVENEIRERFLWVDFKFSPGIGKIILSSRNFFSGIDDITSFKELDIFVCSFSRLKERFEDLEILKKCGSNGVVRLKIENR